MPCEASVKIISERVTGHFPVAGTTTPPLLTDNKRCKSDGIRLNTASSDVPISRCVACFRYRLVNSET